MFFDFEALLVLLTLVSGVVWGWDKWASRGAKSEEEQRSVSWWVDLARSLFPVILAVLVIRSFLVEPFRIPSPSMVPTLYAGDFILVNKFAYGLRLPVTHTKLLDLGGPERGDVVVFRYPEDPSQDYIKRLIGLPGDRIAYRNKRLYVNGELMQQLSLGAYRGVGVHHERGPHELKREELAEVDHQIVLFKQPGRRGDGLECPFIETSPADDCEFVVPDKHYFMMGDNRDYSSDSRYWGFVPEQNLVGEAFLIWLSVDPDRYRVNWGRIGDPIN